MENTAWEKLERVKKGRCVIANGFQRYVDGLVNLTDTTAAVVLAAPAANERYVIIGMTVTNAHATVGTKVEIRDDTTVKVRGFATANGGGWVRDDDDIIFIGSPGAAITARNVTTGADVDIHITAKVI